MIAVSFDFFYVKVHGLLICHDGVCRMGVEGGGNRHDRDSDMRSNALPTCTCTVRLQYKVMKVRGRLQEEGVVLGE